MRKRKLKDLGERILNHSKRSETGCLIWQGRTDTKGYGIISVGGRVAKGYNGKMKSVHRVAYEQFVGPIPEGAHVCHSCDTPLCVEPSHLWTGSNQDNVDDKVKKGRQAMKVTGDQREWVRASKLRVSIIAEWLGVHKMTVKRIRKKKI